MPEVLRISDHTKILNTISTAVKYYLNVGFAQSNISSESFFVGIDEEYIFINDPDINKKLSNNSEIELQFEIVESAILKKYRFTANSIEQSTHNFFNCIRLPIPKELLLVEQDRKYFYTARDDQQIPLQHYFKEEVFNEEAIGISNEVIRFYSRIPRSVVKKKLWIGKKINDCVLTVPDGIINFSAQIFQVIAGSYQIRIQDILPSDKVRLNNFITRLYLENERHKKFHDGDNPQQYNKVIGITSADEHVVLAVKTVLEKSAYKAVYIPFSDNYQNDLRKKRLQLLILDVEQTNTSAFQIAADLKHQHFWQHLPILILHEHADYNKDKAKQVKALDIINRNKIPELLAGRVSCAVSLEKGIYVDAKSPNILFANDKDHDQAYEMLKWSLTQRFNMQIYQNLGDLMRELPKSDPRVIIINMLSLRLESILQKCEELMKYPTVANIPVLIVAQPEEMKYARPAVKNHLPIQQLNYEVLSKVQSILKK